MGRTRSKNLARDNAEIMTATERREANRLRSERWRRAHGIGPRKPAEWPWLALGVSRSTHVWYRRRAKARQEAALAIEAAQRREVLDRAERFVAQLQAELAESARCHAMTAAIIGELAAKAAEKGGIPAPCSKATQRASLWR